MEFQRRKLQPSVTMLIKRPASGGKVKATGRVVMKVAMKLMRRKLKAAKPRICSAVTGVSPTEDGQTDDAAQSEGESGTDSASNDSY